MLRRRHINADPRGRSMRLLSGVADLARWPFERFAWLLERRLIWPLRERVAGWAPPGRVVGASALAVLAASALAVGILWPSGGGGSAEIVAAPARVAVAPPASDSGDEKPQGPALRGAPPSFGVAKGVGVSKVVDGTAPDAEAATSEAPEPAATTPQPEGGGATTSSTKPVPAGPVAMKV